jgi:hypothetical protein
LARVVERRRGLCQPVHGASVAGPMRAAAASLASSRCSASGTSPSTDASIRTADTSPERYGCRACVHCFLGVTVMIAPGISSRTAVRSVTSRVEPRRRQRNAFDLHASTMRSTGRPTAMSSDSTLCGRVSSTFGATNGGRPSHVR